MPVYMKGVNAVPQMLQRGTFMGSIDHKSGYFHVNICVDERDLFGIFLDGKYYVYTTLCFGWSLSCYVYQTLSDAVVHFLRGMGIPALV